MRAAGAPRVTCAPPPPPPLRRTSPTSHTHARKHTIKPTPTAASRLWGCRGESWDRSRLPYDWSFAGAFAGEKPLPWLPVHGSVKDWGARGDGKSDDTAAIQRAVDAVKEGGALYFPPGFGLCLFVRLSLHRACDVCAGGAQKKTPINAMHAHTNTNNQNKQKKARTRSPTSSTCAARSCCAAPGAARPSCGCRAA